MTPRQSTENREPHTIRAIHPPHPARDRQADRREGDGNRKERKNGNHRTSETTNLPRPVRSSSSHPNTPRTRRHQAAHPPLPHHRSSAEPTQAACYRSFRLPPRPPCRRAGRDETASKQRRHLITLSRRHQPHIIRPHPHGNRNKHGTLHIDAVPLRQASKTGHQTSPPPRSSQRTDEKRNGTR